MSIYLLLATTVGMCLLSFAGGIWMKQFSVTRDALWLVAAYTAYSGSNIMAILLVDQTGIARAMAISSASSIAFFTVAGVFYGERLSGFHFAASALAVCAVVLALLGDNHHHSTLPQPSKEAADA